MSQASAVALVEPQAPQIVALDEWTETRVNFVIQNYCGGAPKETAAAFIQVARKRRLSPEEKQIYLIKRADKWSVETSIDGYRLIADRSEAYAGSDMAIFGPTVDGHPESAMVTVYKIVQGQRVPFSAIAYWDEFAPVGNQAFMWAKMPRHMLAKVAEAHALRKAFPADLSGIYVAEEMHQAEDVTRSATVRDVTPRAGAAKPKAVAASAPSATDDDLVTIEQVKALVDLGRRKRLGELDVAMLFGGEGWENRMTQGQAKQQIAWMSKATPTEIETRFSLAMADAPTDAVDEMADVDAAVDGVVIP